MTSQVKVARCKMAVPRAVFSKLSNGGFKKNNPLPIGPIKRKNRLAACEAVEILRIDRDACAPLI